MTAQEVSEQFYGYEKSLSVLIERSKRCGTIDNEVGNIQTQLMQLEADILKLKDEIGTIKNQANIKTRVASVIDTMTPFAQRPTPNGGNK